MDERMRIKDISYFCSNFITKYESTWEIFILKSEILNNRHGICFKY